MIKKKNIPVAQMRKLFKELSEYLPEWLNSPISCFSFILNVFNDVTMVICYLLLIGQSAKLLSKDAKNVDSKILLFKWIITIVFHMIFCQIQKDNIVGGCIQFIFLTVVVVIVYPSAVSKEIFKRYFEKEINKQQQNTNDESVVFARNSLIQKNYEFFVIFLLKIVKVGINFMHPVNRKQIEKQINEINKILGQQKYDRKITEAEMKRETIKKQQNPEEVKKKNEEIEKTPDIKNVVEKQLEKSNISHFQVFGNNPKIKDVNSSIYQLKDSIDFMKQSSQIGMRESTSLKILKDSMGGNRSQAKSQKATKKYRKYSVSEYLSLFNTTNRSKFVPNSPSTKRCTYYRQIEISYDVDSAVLTSTSLEDMKVSYHNLQEILLLDDLMIQFQFQDNQNMIIKFKSKIQFEEFINAIDVHESGLQK